MSENALFTRPTPLAQFGAYLPVADARAALLFLGQDRAIERATALYDLLGAGAVLVGAPPAPDAHAELGSLLEYHKTQWIRQSPEQTTLAALFPQRGFEGIFLQPAETPSPSPQTLQELARVFLETRPEAAIPVCAGRAGWPWVLRPDLPRSVLNAAKAIPETFARVEVPDELTLCSATQEDGLRRLRAAALAEPVPSRALCRSLLRQAQQPDRRIAHCHRVAAIGLRLTRALNVSGMRLNEELVYASCLAHDVAKGQKGHHLVGARLLRGLGHFQAAHAVDSHTEIHWRPEQGLNETALLYLADKLVKGVKLMGVEQRFRYWLDDIEDPEDRRILTRRLKTARAIEDQVAQALGQSVMGFLTRAPREREVSDF